MGDISNPFSRNQNIMDANREFLYKITDIERSAGKAATEYVVDVATGDENFQKGTGLAGDVADLTAMPALDLLRDNMAKSLVGSGTTPREELAEVRFVLEKYNIRSVSGSPAQVQERLFHIMHRKGCPKEVRDACRRGINAAKAQMLSSGHKGIRRARVIKVSKRRFSASVSRSEFGQGYGFAGKCMKRARDTLKLGISAILLAKRMSTFAHLSAEAGKARMAAAALKKNPNSSWALKAQKKTAAKQAKREAKHAKAIVWHSRHQKFRRWANDPVGLKRKSRKLADRLLRTKAGRTVSAPFRVLATFQRIAASAVTAAASVLSMLFTMLLCLGIVFTLLMVFISIITSVIGGILSVFDFTVTDEEVQKRLIHAMEEAYNAQVEEINACYGNYEHVTVNHVSRRTDSVYEEAETAVEQTANVAEVLSMTNIYFDFDLEKNADDAVDYAKALFVASNPVDYSVSVCRTEDSGEVDAEGNPVMVTYYDADITVTTYYFNDIFEVNPDTGGDWTGDMSGLPAWITPDAMQAVMEVQRDKNIPAAAILGQMIHESTGKYPGGCSGLCYSNNNCLGITGHKCQIKGTSSNSWNTKEYYGKYVSTNRKFQAYKSLGDCIRCYSSTDVVTGRSGTLRKCTIDPKTGHYSTVSYVTAVWNAGYATSPTYVQNVMKAVKAYNLERFNYMSPSAIVASGTLTGAQAMIACGDYYCSVLDAAVKRGEKWVYSNSGKYVKQAGTFEQMLNGKVRGGNCASIANWAYRDMGIIKVEQKFYGNSSGQIQHYNAGSTKVKRALDKNCIIIKCDGKKFSTLVKEGKVQPGDVLMGKGHTFVYRGDGIVFASGHDGKWHRDNSAKTEDSNKAVFESWKRPYRGTYDENFKPTYILRIKPTYVPVGYRDANGRLVKNR